MDWLPMQPYDILMIVIIVGMTLHGALKGVAWQIASLASIVVSVFVALRFNEAVAPIFSKQEPWNRFVAMLVLYLVTSLAIWLVFRFVSELIDKIKLDQFDRQAGALFGLAKGILFALLLTFFAVTLSEITRQVVLKARSGHFASVFIHKALPVLPKEIQEKLGDYIAEFDHKLDPQVPAGEDPIPGKLRDAAGKLIEKVEGKVGGVLSGSGTTPAAPEKK